MTARFLQTIHGADGAIISIDLREAISPAEFATGCQDIVRQLDGHAAHKALDALVSDLLTNLGYGEAMDIFLQHVDPYHTDGKR
jgi:hypothetical protein